MTTQAVTTCNAKETIKSSWLDIIIETKNYIHDKTHNNSSNSKRIISSIAYKQHKLDRSFRSICGDAHTNTQLSEQNRNMRAIIDDAVDNKKINEDKVALLFKSASAVAQVFSACFNKNATTVETLMNVYTNALINMFTATVHSGYDNRETFVCIKKMEELLEKLFSNY